MATDHPTADAYERTCTALHRASEARDNAILAGDALAVAVESGRDIAEALAAYRRVRCTLQLSEYATARVAQRKGPC